jgi:soluble cytochrome b562
MFKSAISAFILATSFSFVISTTAQAADLSHDMHQLKSGYKAFSKAGNAGQALAALNQMQQAAQSAKQATPEGVDPSNAQQVVAYQDQLNQLSATISAANDLVQAGKLADAKALGKKMLQIRDNAHEQFR